MLVTFPMALACPTNQLQWQRLNVILAAGFFCPLMQTPFALSSIFLGCRFCKHSTLVSWTYWMFNKPTLTVWKSPAKILQDVTNRIQTWAPKTTWSQRCCPLSLSHTILTFSSPCFLILQLQHISTATMVLCKQTHLLYARMNQFIHWPNFNSEKPLMIYYIFYLFKKTRLTCQCKYAMLIMHFAR